MGYVLEKFNSLIISCRRSLWVAEARSYHDSGRTSASHHRSAEPTDNQHRSAGLPASLERHLHAQFMIELIACAS